MNTNAVHNIINVLIAALAAALLASGCTSTVAGSFDCSASWIDPKFTAWAIGALGMAKIGMNIWRDGLGGLLKRQPPVVK